MKVIKLLFVVVFGIAVGACGGGGGGGGNTGGSGNTSGTAAQYFTKKAVGNTWTTVETTNYTAAGQTTAINSVITRVDTITSATGGVITGSRTSSSGSGGSSTITYTLQIDATGALVWTDLGTREISLPAIFSVGTTWEMSPADPALGRSGMTGTIVAMNVTRTVPAGTFTDCLQINTTYTRTDVTGVNTHNGTIYISPTAGNSVDGIFSVSYATGSVENATMQLKAGYIANP